MPLGEEILLKRKGQKRAHPKKSLFYRYRLASVKNECI